MSRFIVPIHREALEIAFITVEADDETGAITQALDLAQNHPDKIYNQWMPVTGIDTKCKFPEGQKVSLVTQESPLSAAPLIVDPKDPELSALRSKIRLPLLAEILLGKLCEDTLYSVSFDGYGDSGSMSDTSHEDMPDGMVDFLFKCEKFASAQGYENDSGGGCTVSWHIRSDVLTVTSFYNVVNSEDQPDVQVLP